MKIFSDFAEFQTWANLKILEMLRNTPTEHGLTAFAHLLGANLVWGSRLAGTAPECAVVPNWNLDECEVAIGRISNLFEQLAPDLCETRLVDYKTSTGIDSRSTVGEIMLQLWGHNAYHRGEIAREIIQQGGRTPDTDYIIFARSKNC